MSEVYTDAVTEVHSFDEIFKCHGFYSSSQITVKDSSSYIWIVLIGFILAVIFILVMNSYWPLLFDMYKQLKKLVETKTKQNIDSYTVIQAKVETVKEDANLANDFARRISLL
jgi:ABC-type multidrug transport system fused ATPase/permease subunit